MALNISRPTETVELPSQGLLYPEGHPLADGKVEIKYMTAKEEDILSNSSYLANGTVVDKLLQALIVTDVNYNDILVTDKEAILIAARILGYGKMYKFIYDGEERTVDLSTLDNKPLDPVISGRTENDFKFTLPHSGIELTFKFLTHGDEQKIQQEIAGLEKINQEAGGSLRLKYMITSVNGTRDNKDIREFVDNYLLARDARELRNYVVNLQPGVDLAWFPEPGGDSTRLPIGLSFLYPDA